jgi:hypothetical protein
MVQKDWLACWTVTKAVGETRGAASKVLEASEAVEAAATRLQRGIEGFLGRVAV